MTLPPYAAFLGLRVEPSAEGARLLAMPFGDDKVGRPGFLHGGVIAGLLEMAAVVALADAMPDDFDATRIKPISATIDFTRGGRERTTYARGTIARLGTRVANVEAVAWQDDRDRPIAVARMNYLLAR